MRGDDLVAHTIYVKFRIGDIVYVKTNTDKWPGMVLGYDVRPAGNSYFVGWPDGSNSYHYDIELTREFIKTFDTDSVDD